MPQLDATFLWSTLFWLTIAWGALFGFMQWYVWPVLLRQRADEERQRRALSEQIKQKKQDLEQWEQQYQEALSKERQEGEASIRLALCAFERHAARERDALLQKRRLSEPVRACYIATTDKEALRQWYHQCLQTLPLSSH